MVDQNIPQLRRLQYLYTIKDRIRITSKKALASDCIQIEGLETVARTHKLQKQ